MISFQRQGFHKIRPIDHEYFLFKLKILSLWSSQTATPHWQYRRQWRETISEECRQNGEYFWDFKKLIMLLSNMRPFRHLTSYIIKGARISSMFQNL